MKNTDNQTPKQLSFRFPAEWEKHIATWLSYPHKEASWPGKIESIFPFYNLFIKELSEVEKVHINVNTTEQQAKITQQLKENGSRMENLCFHLFPTNDAWIRDHGPSFLVSKEGKRALVNWEYNAWGGKYESDLDNLIPKKIGEYLGLPVFDAGIVMEGGSIDVNGKGDLITSKSCLLNPNRNPELSQQEIETKLYDYYGVENVLWLEQGIEGDDTDGHVDDMTRFVNEDTLITMVEEDKQDENYIPLQENLKLLKTFRLLNGKQPNIVEIKMPKPVYYQEERLPASYANFYICNKKVIVPIYKCSQDDKAIYLLEEVFKDRQIIGIDSTDIIWGLGSFHCLSQQEIG
ncbi:MAG: agmatine deiminase family protein [Bacteroidota bacterium]|nr:agmatine deiminase family protein [Bacteroidota bacterium]